MRKREQSPSAVHVSAGASGDRFASSQAHQERARLTLPGGVASAFRGGQQPVPVCFADAEGVRLVDVDGNEYLDWALGWGPLLLGHTPGPVLDAVRGALAHGLAYGGAHRLEVELAEAVCRSVPSAERCVFSSTGSEAVHVALRIARAATGRNRVVKFQGHYHGWLDGMHVGLPGRADDGPGTAGQDPGAAAAVTVCPWDDLPALAAVLGSDVAAVIMEPIAVNAGCLVASPGYLEGAKRLVRDAGALLVFDEVITGFRLALGGAQEHLGVLPDLTVLGKALGAGFPISAVAGRAEVMSVVPDLVAHVGTFNANPVCTAAAIAAIEVLERDAREIYPALDAVGSALAEAFRSAGSDTLPIAANQLGGVVQIFVSDHPVTTYEDTLAADPAAVRSLAGALLERGVQIIPRGLCYVSTCHEIEDAERTGVALAEFIKRLDRQPTEAH